jgi:hypothetical protein
MHKKVKELFAGDHKAMALQLRDDLDNAGYSLMGQLAKKNEIKKTIRGVQGAFLGTLATIPAGMYISKKVVPPVLEKIYEHTGSEGVTVGAALAGNLMVSTAVPVIGAMIGREIGRATYKPKTIEGTMATHQHPLLIPPKEVKAKSKIDMSDW